ncbi:CynX/NimT family MFS transporter [Candidatus Enterococcus ferrettii]|uniref:MFS transporter, CP family, cyanate transporter n=1 Tax=Candidatus Enterococcus ferrettii TaxID=2815324 RepID=A0ABV0EHN2_9ENTE|nr:MFS transporter [Enterococcus sp. 665A]MBO1338616.1 MFS transporter [Enterococcus sp. 665A]
MTKKKTVLLIFLVAFNLRLGISSVAPILATIQRSLHLSNFSVSLLISIPVICMGVLAFLVAFVQKKLGRNKGIFLFLLILGVATLSRGVFNSFLGLVVSTLLIGCSIALIGPLLSGFIKEIFPEKAGLLIGIYSLSMGLGSVSASSLMGPLTRYFNGQWSTALAVWGLLAIISGFIWKLLADKTTSPATSKQFGTSFFADKKLWKLALFFGIQSGVFYSFTTWITSALLSKGVSPIWSITLLTTFTAVQMISSFLIPTLMDKFGTTKQWIICCSFCLLGSALLLIFANRLFMLVISILLAAIATGGFFPIAMLLPIRESQDASQASIYASIVQAFGYMIGGITPVLIGSFIDLTNSTASLYWFLLIGAILLLIVGHSLESEETDGKQTRVSQSNNH